MPILVSHAVPDGPWAEWITHELRAAGYAVDVHIARTDFVERLLAALSGSDPVLVLLSAEHPGVAADWQRITDAGGDLVPLCLDASTPALTCRSLHGLDEEEVLELLLGLLDRPRRHPIG
ncbi:hypothetical protein FB565_001509 [Actinoplanes lutulentus]|uniref:toll/interleukin-1 receptor domain-containing protein n=1 Tax=Actinoplanes lutulentus TaxID=1287878 RepID=UPI0015EB743E|nr:toll/interleukin-1 receptor domain-containing protein [Actinoplanes lutulentus]MBB2941805.1 hypothetical protein [Actinoplanes lutulentus]